MSAQLRTYRRMPRIGVLVLCALGACFDVKLSPEPDSGSNLDAGRDTQPRDLDAEIQDLDAEARDLDAQTDAGLTACPEAPPGGAIEMFGTPAQWDPGQLNAFVSAPEQPPLALCSSEKECAHGKCLLVKGSEGVCVEATRCQLPLVYQQGSCTSCVSVEEKAAICRMRLLDVDCREWPFASLSIAGGSCAKKEDCEAGLVCSQGRAAPWLGTCVCPGAVVNQSTAFFGCGSPDTPRDREPGLGIFNAVTLPRIVLVGDLLAAEVENWVRFAMGIEPKVEYMPPNVLASEAALCDFLEDRPGPLPPERRLGQLVAASARKPLDAIALQFWGWAKSPCMMGLEPGSEPYYARLLDDASAAVEEVERAARDARIRRPRLFWMLQGPDRDRPERAARVNDIYRLIARYHGDYASDAGYFISLAAYSKGDPKNRDRWVDWLPCTMVEQDDPFLCTRPNDRLAQIHPPSDSVRLCLHPELPLAACSGQSPGTLRVAEVISGDLKRFFGLLPRVAP